MNLPYLPQVVSIIEVKLVGIRGVEGRSDTRTLLSPPAVASLPFDPGSKCAL